MSTDIFWFSGTGNSLKLAKDIASQMQGVLRSIAKEVKNPVPISKAEVIGFILPTYYLGVPKVVEEFIKKLQMENPRYIFVLATRGWPIVGGVIRQMKSLLRTKSMSLNYGAYFTMPGNDFTFAKVATIEEQKRLLAQYPLRFEKVIAELKIQKRRYDMELTAPLLPIRRKVYLKNAETTPSAYSVADSCSGCGLCAKVCPVGNIRLKESRPIWDNSCQICLACFHYCPKKAILYDGIGKEILHYHHPDISASTLQS